MLIPLLDISLLQAVLSTSLLCESSSPVTFPTNADPHARRALQQNESKSEQQSIQEIRIFLEAAVKIEFLLPAYILGLHNSQIKSINVLGTVVFYALDFFSLCNTVSLNKGFIILHSIHSTNSFFNKQFLTHCSLLYIPNT